MKAAIRKPRTRVARQGAKNVQKISTDFRLDTVVVVGEGTWLRMVSRGVHAVGVVHCIALPFPLPDRIRYAGVAYNFTAIALAVVMLIAGVYLHKWPPAFSGWGSYFSSFFPVFFRLRVINLEAHMTESSDVFAGAAVARASLSGTNEEKIEQLDQRTRNMESRIDTLQGSFHKQTQEFEERLKKERLERSDESEAVRQLVRKSLFGDHGWELVVALYLVLGLLANIPNEVAKFIFGYTGPWS
jgi:hypothetical protein